ncbi:MAG: 6-phospho-beta-glucosidase [Pseudonocardiales bacterium]|jgi:6-phospho-beta-glucosidase|nr:6-phospho-beta-glucosidase [Pseudonocardiales bacterium]
MRLVVVGGGGFRVPLVYRELLRRPELGIDELVLHDVDADRLATIGRVLPPDPAIRLRLETSVTAAVRDADFVFSAIRVGGAAGRVADERRALSVGVLGQETVGAGGLAYGLRTLPVALELARTVADLAPRAWLVNFTNPAGMVTEASRTVLGERAIGICDSPVGLVRRASRALGVAEAELRSGRVAADYVGINHLGWLRALVRDGVDLLPGLLRSEAALASFEEGRLFGGALLRALRAIPNEYLHFYYHHAEALAVTATGPTRGEFLLREQRDFYAAAAARPAEAAARWEATRRRREESYLAEARPADQPRDEQDLAGGGYQEAAFDLMHALSGGSADRLIVNVANQDTLPGLPPESVIEVPCRVDATGARPLPVAPLDLHQLGLIASVRAAEQAAVEAATTGSYAAALCAFTLSPLVNSAAIAQRLLDALLHDDPALARLLSR